jgi:hypothetical protein
MMFGLQSMVLLWNKDFVLVSDGFVVKCFKNTKHEKSLSLLAGLSVLEDIKNVHSLSFISQEGQYSFDLISLP